MAYSKVIFNGNTIMDATTATAAAADITAPKTAMLADGVMTTGTGSGGSGGGSDYTLIASEEVEVDTTSTTATTLVEIPTPEGQDMFDAMYYIRIRDKAGKRAGYYYGADTWIVNQMKANGTSSFFQMCPTILYAVNSSGKFVGGANSSTGYATSGGSAYGVYVSSILIGGSIRIQAKYSSSLGTISGTFSIEVYKLKWPNNVSPLL